MHLNQNELSIPNPKKEGDLRLKFDMRSTFAAESRVEEIAFVTPSKAPELMATMSAALRDLSSHLAHLHFHAGIAAKKVRERRAVVVTEIIPTKLAEKKLSNNDSTREAIIELDPEYSAVSEVELEVEAAQIFVREKFRSVESHLNAIKKSMDATANLLNYSANTNLTQPVTQTEEAPTKQYNNLVVGKARYGSQ
jgi:hypothetical protein